MLKFSGITDDALEGGLVDAPPLSPSAVERVQCHAMASVNNDLMSRSRPSNGAQP